MVPNSHLQCKHMPQHPQHSTHGRHSRSNFKHIPQHPQGSIQERHSHSNSTPSAFEKFVELGDDLIAPASIRTQSMGSV